MINKKVSLVLSSGGARGISQIGVIEELERRAYSISSIAGCSIGAMVGGIYASGKLPEFKDWLLSLTKMEVFRLMDFSFNRKGFLKAEKVFEKINPFISQKNIEDLPIHFVAVATDIYNNKEICFTKASLTKAIRASVAIPVFIQARGAGDTILVDGGVMNPLPINRLVRSHDDILIAVNVNDLSKDNVLFKSKFKKDIAQKSIPKDIGLFDIMNMSFELTISQLVNCSLRENRPDLLIQIPRSCAGTFEFYNAEKLIEMGRFMAKHYLDEFEKETGFSN